YLWGEGGAPIEDLTALLSRHLRVPAMYGDINSIPDEVVQCLPPEVAGRYKALPFRRVRKKLHIGIADAQDSAAIGELKLKSGFDIIPYVLSEIQLLYGLEKYYGIKHDRRHISSRSKDTGTAVGEEACRAPGRVKGLFINAATRAEVTGHLIAEAQKAASRTILFAIKEAVVELLATDGLNVRGHTMKKDRDFIISQVLSRKLYYRGPLPAIAANKPLIELLGGAPMDCLILPVGIREKILFILYADNGPGTVLQGNVNYLHDLAKMASLALEITLLKEKIADL
ncbi:MAG: GspE/PulE/PilB domain-containing protein, partial [Thermodesulfovibrionales bacterium]